jgi:RNA polymerase sigma-70 factor (ECF subfamily)
MVYIGNPEEAAQLTQDTFLDVFRSASSFGNGPSLAPWLFRIARNNLLPFQRRQAKFRFESLDDLLLSPGLPVPIVEHDGFAEGTVLKDAISLTLAAMRPTLREALVLNALAGLTAREIAVLLEIRTEAAEQRLTRAKARFRELWHELGETENGPRIQQSLDRG